MTSKKLGALLRSAPPATAPAETPEVSPLAMPLAPAREPELPRHTPSSAITEPEVPLQVLIPVHIRKQLAVKAAEEGRSLRALMLRAIQSLGIEVTDEEIRGKRGRRNL